MITEPIRAESVLRGAVLDVLYALSRYEMRPGEPTLATLTARHATMARWAVRTRELDRDNRLANALIRSLAERDYDYPGIRDCDED